MSRVEHLAEGVTLYLGDARSILLTLGKVDAIVTDPPYGIKAGREKPHNGWRDYGISDWDLLRPPASLIHLLREMSDQQIIWGGNYFTDILPPTMQWLIWDKGQRDFSLADLEMAWSSQKAASRIFDYPRALALQDGKEHPTQKPLEVMKWCLGFVPEASLIVDPFAGSFTTGVAAVKLGRKFVGIEIDPNYFEIGCRRIADALNRPDMFIEPPKPIKQEAFL